MPSHNRYLDYSYPGPAKIVFQYTKLAFGLRVKTACIYFHMYQSLFDTLDPKRLVLVLVLVLIAKMMDILQIYLSDPDQPPLYSLAKTYSLCYL
jgi:hypothetical protein